MIPGYKTSFAISYLTDAFNMGYTDASYELAKAHQGLAKIYSNEGGKEIHQHLIGAQK